MIARKKRSEPNLEPKVDPAVGVESGSWVPVIDLRRCKGCGECVDTCPHHVLEVRRIKPDDYVRLGWLARMKVRHHGLRAAYALRTSDCQGCGQCLEVCPEKAIRLEAGPQPGPHLKAGTALADDQGQGAGRIGPGLGIQAAGAVIDNTGIEGET